MIFPKDKEIYEYEGKKYIVTFNVIFNYVYVQEVVNENNTYGSQFSSINWWKFMWKAKHIGTTKLNYVY